MSKSYESKNDLEMHWIPVRHGWILDDGDDGASAFLYKDGEMIEIHSLVGKWTCISVNNLSFIAERLGDFALQIEEFEHDLELRGWPDDDSCIHPEHDEILTEFDQAQINWRNKA